MPISINVNRLEKFNEVRNKVIFADLVLRCIEFLHEIKKGGQLKALGI